MHLRFVRCAKCLVAATLVVLGAAAALSAVWSQEKEAPKSADFAKLHAQWTQVVKDMRKVQIEFRTAGEKERVDLRIKFESKSKEARAMLPQLAAAGEAALSANPADGELRDFLLSLADVASSINDDYDMALRV